MQHRVNEICSLTSKDSWGNCPSHLYPADLPSRGLTAKTLATCETWWKGPELLYLPESEWPENQTTQSEDELVLKEVVKSPSTTVHSLESNSGNMPEKKIDQIIDINQFHDLTKLLSVTALVIKAAESFKNSVINKEGTRREHMRLNATDVNEAEPLWILTVQQSAFSKEIAFLLQLW